MATAAREDRAVTGRITHLIEDGRLFGAIGEAEGFDPETDRVMICGSEGLLKDPRQICLDHGFIEGSNAAPADFVVEKAFVATD